MYHPTLSQKNEVKLAKRVKREPRKASFPWDIGLMFMKPIKYALILHNIDFITAKGNLMHAIYKFSLNFHAKNMISLKLDLDCEL